MDNMRKILKENIKKYRHALKHDGIEYCKSTSNFAEHIGIEPNTYKNYEMQSKDIVPPYENLIKIATALSVSIDKLFNYEPPDKLESFLKDLGIHYKKDVSGNYVLSYPFKSKHVIDIEYKDLKLVFELWRDLKPKDLSKFEKQFIFMSMVAELNNPDVISFNIAENLIKQIEKLKEWRKKSEKEKDTWSERIKKATEKSYDYGFMQFRGGK